MPHQNTVFHDLTKRIPWDEFSRLVAAHDANAGCRSFSSKHHLLALLYGQFGGMSGLRETAVALKSWRAQLYHAGAKPVARSTFSDANARRPRAIFSGLLSCLLGQVGRGLRRDVRECVHLIDSSTMKLNELSADWSRFSKDSCGVKMHVAFDPDADQPVFLDITPSRINDITAAKTMPIQPGATYVFDLGYYDYAWWAKLHAAGCRFVTRFKSNTPLINVQERVLPEGSAVLSDRVGRLPQRQANARKNPFQDKVREVRVKTETGKVLRVLTNDLEAKAQKVADLYKRRWMIELFFRWVKQVLRIKKFIGTNENAVRIQIIVAIIAYVLLRMAQQDQKSVASPLDFARLVRINLMQPRRIDKLLQIKHVVDHPKQLALGVF